MNKEFLEEREFKKLLAEKKYKIYFQEESDCVIAETEVGDEYEYYSMNPEEIEQKIYEGIKSRSR